MAVEQGIRSFDAKMKRSGLDMNHPGYQPLFPKAGWRKDAKSREKALKRGNWFRGRKDDEPWEGLPTPKSDGKIKKRKKILQKAGWKGKLKQAAATVVFVPSTRGSTLLRSLKEDEDRMAEITGFRVKYQEAGGSILANAFNKNLGSGSIVGEMSVHPVGSRKEERTVKLGTLSTSPSAWCAIQHPAMGKMIIQTSLQEELRNPGRASI